MYREIFLYILMFEIHRVAPENYQLFAWSDLQGYAYRNAEFMKKYDDNGLPLKIEKDSLITQDLTVLP
jgi:hypothetical protein